jgi:hypothetical protein
LLALTLATAAALAASACYWTTMIAELSWMKKSSVAPNSYFDYRRNFVFSPFTLGNTNSWLSSMLALATLSLAFAPLIVLFSPYRKKLCSGLKIVFGLFALSMFMTTDLSRPIWIVVPKLKEVQFPWRWLVVSSTAVPLLAAASVPFWKEQMRGKFRWAAIVALGSVLVSLTYSFARVREANYLPRFEFGSASNSVFSENSLDYWHEPVWMSGPPAAMPNQVEAKERTVSINSWDPELRKFWIGQGPAEEIRVRTFYYPHWIAKTSGMSLQTRPDNDGALLISVPAEATSINLQFQEPKRTRIATGVSASAWILLLLALLLNYFRKNPKIDATGLPRGASRSPLK